MGLFDKLRGAAQGGARPGATFTGPAAYCTEPGVVPWPGFYALSADGKQIAQPPLRLVAVDDAPGDPNDGAWHLEVARPGDPPQKNGNIVPLEAHATGHTEVAS